MSESWAAQIQARAANQYVNLRESHDRLLAAAKEAVGVIDELLLAHADDDEIPERPIACIENLQAAIDAAEQQL